MKKYLQVMKISFQQAFAYKENFIITSVMNILRIIAEIVFWTIIFQLTNNTEIKGYNYESIITYYVLMFIIGTLMNQSRITHMMSFDIKNGQLNQYIVKPINYLGYYFSRWSAEKLLQIFVTLIVFIPVFIFGYSKFVFNISSEQLILIPLILILSILLHFYLNVFIALLSFYFIEISSLFTFKEILFSFLTGEVFPLDILSEKVTFVFSLLPFQYIVYFPIRALNKGYTNFELFKGIGMQIIWIIILWLLTNFAWYFGKKRYYGTGM